MRLRLPAALLAASLASAASAGTVDEDLIPGGSVVSTIFPSTEVETYRVGAPAGSVLAVDLRPLRKGLFAPVLGATLSDGSGGQVPALPASGRTRATLPFPVDGVLVLRVYSGRGGAGDYRLRTRLSVPKGPDFAGTVGDAGPATFAFTAPAGATATVAARAVEGSDLVPSILSLAGAGGPTAPGSRRAIPTLDLWRSVPLPDAGPWTLTVGGAIGTKGDFTVGVRWKPPRGPDEDRRATAAPAVLAGSYAVLLSSTSPAGSSLPSILAGGADLDGRGRARTALDDLALAPDATGPFGIGVLREPLAGTRGAYFTDGSAATVAFDLGSGRSRGIDFTVAAGGSILHAGAGDPAATTAGMMLRRTAVPTAAQLAGTWLYAIASTDGGGTTTVEVGTLTLSSAGTVAGVGASTPLTLVGGTPTQGSQTPVLRTGGFTVGKGGVVTVVTVPDLVGAPETWTAGTVYGADILAGLDATGGGSRLFLRQGTGLSDAAVTGDYLHFGVALGAAFTLRSGTLAFDGAGAFSGQESLVDLAGGGPGSSGPVGGTYSVDSSGIATFGYSGGPSGTGVVGPEGRYLFTIGMEAGGVAVDLLLSLK